MFLKRKKHFEPDNSYFAALQIYFSLSPIKKNPTPKRKDISENINGMNASILIKAGTRKKNADTSINTMPTAKL